MANGDTRPGFGWIDPRDLTGGAGAWPSGSGGGAGITGGAGGSGGGAGVTGAAGGRPRSGVTGGAGPYDPYGDITGDAGPYDPFGVTGGAGPYDPFGVTGGAGPYNVGGENQMSYAEFFSGDRSLLASDVPKPATNLTPYLAIGVVALIAFVALKK